MTTPTTHQPWPGINQCVFCGLCVPLCPTYRLTQEESESPRGRIALIQAYTRGQLPYSATLAQHLEHCVGCRACEQSCPAEVPYTSLMDQTRALLHLEKPQTFSTHLARWALHQFIPYPSRLQKLVFLGRILQQGGLLTRFQTLVTPPWQARLRLLPKTFPPPLALKHHYPPAPNIKAQGTVALFTGCIAAILDTETIRAAIFSLNYLGYTVQIPPQQTCCGALPQHQGELALAAHLKQRNQAAFSTLPIQAVITTATGCQSTLQAALATHKPVYDIHTFINTYWNEKWSIPPCKQTVFLQEPCTLAAQDKTQLYALLSRIPKLRIQRLPLAGCCGAGGSHLMQYPDHAAAILARQLSPLPTPAPHSLILSPNIGCALLLAKEIPYYTVQHPLILLARLLRASILNKY